MLAIWGNFGHEFCWFWPLFYGAYAETPIFELPTTVLTTPLDTATEITSHTAVWECCKDDQQSQWEMPYFGVCQHQNPWVDFQKNCKVDYVGDPTLHASIGVNRFKGGVSAHAWNCHPHESIFARDSIYAKRAYAIAIPSVCPSVRLSVRPSHGWISQKRLKLGSCNFHHTVAPSL